jgi:hypothetical protein
MDVASVNMFFLLINCLNIIMRSFLKYLTEDDDYDFRGDLWFHGTLAKYVRPILQDQAITPRKDNRPQTSGGLLFERDFVYFTNKLSIAEDYAGGIEYQGEDRQRGAIFMADDRFLKKQKIIHLHSVLNPQQLEIVNSFLPNYKPLHAGDTLNKFHWRTNHPLDFTQVLAKLGYTGYRQSKNQLSIFGAVPVVMYEDLRGS